MNRIREFLNTPAGRYVSFGVAGLGVLLMGWLVVSQFTGGIASRSAKRIFIDSNTNEQFQYTLSKGEMIPVPSPHSDGARVGFEAEPCYWTKEGGVKDEPTWVLPKVKVNPDAGPTFCHDCGRLVVPLNPLPLPGTSVPPSETEYKARRSSGLGAADRNGDRVE